MSCLSSSSAREVSTFALEEFAKFDVLCGVQSLNVFKSEATTDAHANSSSVCFIVAAWGVVEQGRAW